MRRKLIYLISFILMLAGAVQADLRLVENFDTMATGSPDGVACTGVIGGTWDTESANTGNVAVEDNSGSRVVRFMSQSAGLGRGVGFNGITDTIDDSETGYVFFRFMIRSDSQVPRTYIGLISNTSADPITGTNTNTPTNIPAGFGLVDNGLGGFNLVETNGTTVLKSGLARAQWYNVWIVADNTNDVFDLYLSTATGPAGAPTQPTSGDLVAGEIPFGIATSVPLTGMIFASPAATVQSSRCYIDEIYWDGTEGLATAKEASSPSPANNQTDVPCDLPELSWKPGEFAKTHDVYFGTNLDNVKKAGVANPLGVQVSPGRDANSFDLPVVLHLDQTCYWRVDEVNGAPDYTVFPGSVWSFTVEPFARIITNITATALSTAADSNSMNTVNDSDLDANGLHSRDSTKMWITVKDPPGPVWIQYDFDRLYKLYQMKVWNYNAQFEDQLGFGLKNVTIEYFDGTSWTTLGSFEFAQGPGTDGYASKTTVDFGGVPARQVKITANSNYGGHQYGLSEVRFYYIPAHARVPEPASGATDVGLDTVLKWRAGREAASHEIYFSSDRSAVESGTALAGTVSRSSYPLSSLGIELGKTYYWKVNEVNEAAIPRVWEGDIWSLTTTGYVTVDDFEQYDIKCNRVYYAWEDGIGYDANATCGVAKYDGNKTGSTVGSFDAPFVETTIVRSGSTQSMPLEYNNASPPYYSQAQRRLASAQDWTKGGAKTLSVYVRGNAPPFVEFSLGNIVMNGMGVDIYVTADEGRFACKQLNGDGSIIARVDSLGNTHAWAKAGVMIRETLNAGSSWAFVLYSSQNGAHFQARLTTGAGATSDTALTLPPEQTGARAPVWVKLERKGSQFYGYYSTNAAEPVWTPMVWNPQTITMADNVYIGLAVTSHVAGVVCGARFSSVTTTGAVTGDWQVNDLGVPQSTEGNTLETFYVTVEDSLGNSRPASNQDRAAIATGDWVECQIPLTDFIGVNMQAIKKISIGVGNLPPANSQAGGSGKIYIDDIRLYPAIPVQ